MNTIKIRDCVIGGDIPAICTPAVGKSVDEIVNEIQFALNEGADIIEWRADMSDYTAEDIPQILTIVNNCTQKIPLIFTYRSKNEGGCGDLSLNEYINLYKSIIDSGLIDIIDIELSKGDKTITYLTEYAHSKNIQVIISYHNFDITPPVEYMIDTVNKMLSLGADIPKIAVMPTHKIDVLNLLFTTEQLYRVSNKPLITVAMSELGFASRVIGGLYGSALTFASAKYSSAPGQISISKLKQAMKAVYR